MHPLLTIGHSSHSWERFAALIQEHEIEVIADVRSTPYSRWCPWFTREPLRAALKGIHCRYVFLGEELGARRGEPECYIKDRADYERIAKLSAFRSGIERLQKGVSEYRVALMCTEQDPLDCHRTVLVSREALEFASICHVLADGSLEPHSDTEKRLLALYDRNGSDFFERPGDQLRSAYIDRGKEINYRGPRPALAE